MLSGFERYWHGDEDGARLLLDDSEPDARRRHGIALAGALAWHVFLIALVVFAPSGAAPRTGPSPMELALRNATPLVEPRLDDPPLARLTQKAPQSHAPTSEVDLAALQPRAQVMQPAQRAAGGSPPPGFTAPPQHVARPTTIDAPQLELPQQTNLSALGNPALTPRTAPPPPPPSRAPYEPAAGNPGLKSLSNLKADLQKNSVEDAARAVIRSGAAGRGTTVGDGDGSGANIGGLMQRGSPGARQSALELLSDPQGVDFKPYLTQVLMAVRKSWFAVLPESARYGRAGRVAIQFSVNRNGEIPKLVIAMPSGAEALDRAAVAGISGAVPLPPLPADFKGAQVRLQLVFSYNMPK